MVELIVPIAMISLGVDFAIHALHRYGEERGKGLGPRPALRVGFAGVMGALVLAMLTDGMAFFSNTVSGIESIIGFGVAAGIAVISSFIIMGVWVPLAFMRLDARRESGPVTGTLAPSPDYRLFPESSRRAVGGGAAGPEPYHRPARSGSRDRGGPGLRLQAGGAA